MATDTIVRVDPKTLLVGVNVRKDTQLTPEFKESIKENGVRIPITAYRDGDDNLVVVDGQRRTLAAVDQAIAEVPVFVTDAPGEQQRIIDQVVVNEQRTELFDDEAIGAVQQLSLFDMKAPAIAKKLGLERDLVDNAMKVGASPAAQKFYEATKNLESATMLAEFDHDPKQQKELAAIGAKSSWQMREKAEGLVSEREKAAVIAEIEAAEGLEMIREPDGYGTGPQPLSHLYTDEKFTERVDGLPHEKVVELAGDGLVAWPSREWADGRRRWLISYGVRGWKDRGLHVQSWYAKAQANAKPSTPEDAEKLKLERRQARLNTKEWVDATTLRIQWLQQLVQRRTMPKGWEPLVAQRLVQNDYSPSMLMAVNAVLQLKDDPRQSNRSQIQKHLEKAPHLAPQIMLAVWAGAIEGGGDFDKKGWGGTWQVSLDQTKAYLKKLAEWGYPLTEFEQLVVAGKVKKTA